MKKVTLKKKLVKRLRKPLLKKGKKTSLGGGNVKVSTEAGIKGFFNNINYNYTLPI